MGKKVAEIIVEQVIRQAKELRRLPWDCGYLTPCINYISGRPYRGVNRLLLADGEEFLTMKQLIDYNKRYKTNFRYISECETDDAVTASRRKTHLVVFYNRSVKEITAEQYESYRGNPYYTGRLVATKDGKYYLKSFVLKYYRVFNIEFCVDENGNSLPPRLARKSFEQYRDNRTEKCIEEVIAEVGSMLLCAETGLKRTQKEVENSKSYVAGWIEWIEKNPDALVLASFQAERAKDFILGTLKDVNEGIGQ